MIHTLTNTLSKLESKFNATIGGLYNAYNYKGKFSYTVDDINSDEFRYSN